MLTRWPTTAGPVPEPADGGPESPPLQDAPIYAALVCEWARAGRATPRTGREAAPDPEHR